MRYVYLALSALSMLAACHAAPPAPRNDGLGEVDAASPPEPVAGEASSPPRVVAGPMGDAAGAGGRHEASAGAAAAESGHPAPVMTAGGNGAGASGSRPPAPAALLPIGGAPAAAACGNGVPEPGETCDGNCPSSCDDRDPCTVDTTTGTAAQCNLRCAHTAITAAKSADRCCPPGANANTDSDCDPLCGNGVRERDERCDGNCLSSCGPSAGCRRQQLVGSASQCTAECVALPITDPMSGDGCCPDGANANNDDDCQPYCGNHVKERNETCDGDCPTSESCYWRSGCVRPVFSGIASQCSSVCETTMITTSGNGDGCCPEGANANNDDDCPAVCGNGVIESRERCDGDCPENDVQCRDDDPCTTEHLEGTGCDRHCTASRELTSCRNVPSGWSLGTMASGSCPQGYIYQHDLPEPNGTTLLWCSAVHFARCTDGDRCVLDAEPGTSPILCLMQAGQRTCPAGTSGRYYGSDRNIVTVCCGGR